MKNERMVGFADESEKFTRTCGFGDVIRLSYEVLFAKNPGELAEEIKRRGGSIRIGQCCPKSAVGEAWQSLAGIFAALQD